MSDTTAASVHGHEVMHLIDLADPPHTRDTLAAAVTKEYGEGVRFHACSADGMTLNDLLAFLAARGKCAESPDGKLTTDIGQMCDHE